MSQHHSAAGAPEGAPDDVTHAGSGAAPGTAAHGHATVASGAPGAAGPGSGTGPGSGRARRSGRRRGPVVLLGLLVPAALVAAWFWSTAAGVFTPVQLPPPQDVFTAAIDLIERGQFFQHIGISTQRVLLGYAIGAILGLAVGALVGLSRLSDVLFAPTIGAFRAVTGLAWVPLLALWIGIGEDSKVTLVAIGAFFPVYTTVAAALRHVDAQLVEAGRAFGLGGVKLLLTVQLPAAMPSVVAGLRLALAQSWLFLVAAELLASSMGLGFLLIDSQNNGRTDRMILAIVLLAVLGKLCDSVFALVQKRVLDRWT
ncbi:ABC transporter permease [Sediminivirga luteola]|uniref:ABC transporter permease n=1 Tax=Sediminivirga luteola TaxID=1774748 RepID=A0A8J2TZR0_9MICO|nr:ABC transporter permease [Sediminivirga luteola]GGA21531.1 ABC transporter permease [Sediminivirga luteola]